MVEDLKCAPSLHGRVVQGVQDLPTAHQKCHLHKVYKSTREDPATKNVTMPGSRRVKKPTQQNALEGGISRHPEVVADKRNTSTDEFPSQMDNRKHDSVVLKKSLLKLEKLLIINMQKKMRMKKKKMCQEAFAWHGTV